MNSCSDGCSFDFATDNRYSHGSCHFLETHNHHLFASLVKRIVLVYCYRGCIAEETRSCLALVELLAHSAVGMYLGSMKASVVEVVEAEKRMVVTLPGWSQRQVGGIQSEDSGHNSPIDIQLNGDCSELVYKDLENEKIRKLSM